MAEITIEVTQADIDKGKPGEACACPVYYGIRAAMPYLRPQHVAVGCENVVITESEHLPLPDDAIEWITRYDDGQPVEPFSFTLDVPDDLLAQVTG